MIKRVAAVERLMCSSFAAQLICEETRSINLDDENQLRIRNDMAIFEQIGSATDCTLNAMAQLCRHFLMILLCNPDERKEVSMDVASTVLLSKVNFLNLIFINYTVHIIGT